MLPVGTTPQAGSKPSAPPHGKIGFLCPVSPRTCHVTSDLGTLQLPRLKDMGYISTFLPHNVQLPLS